MCDTLLHLLLLLFTMVKFLHAKCTSGYRLDHGINRCLLTDSQLQWLAGSLHTFGMLCTRQGNLDEAPGQQSAMRQDPLAAMALHTAQNASAAHVQMLVSRQEASKEHDSVQVKGSAQELQSHILCQCYIIAVLHATIAHLFSYVLLVCRRR